MRRMKLHGPLSAEGWTGIMAGMLDGVRGCLAPSAPGKLRGELDALKAKLSGAPSPAARRRVASEIERLLDGSPALRAAKRRFVKREMGLSPEQFEILAAELKRQAGMSGDAPPSEEAKR